jgi:hypothetical protein
MTIASLATYKPRIKDVLWDAVDSLHKQVNKLCINLNQHPELSDQEIEFVHDCVQDYDNVYVDVCFDDYGDLSKFTQLVREFPDSENIYLICDDDLIYPKTYVEDCKYLLNYLGNPISFGGKKLKQPPYRNFRGSFETWTHVLKGCNSSHRIDLPLTCVTALKRNMLHPDIQIDRKYKNKGDVLFGKWAKESGTTITCPNFSKSYFKYNEKMSGKETIWDDMRQNPKVEKDLAKLLTDLHNTEPI